MRGEKEREEERRREERRGGRRRKGRDRKRIGSRMDEWLLISFVIVDFCVFI